MRYKCLILVLIWIPLIGNAQYRFEKLGIDDGLTENSITDIFCDSDGYLWFSTQDGVSKYNGYEFKNYNISVIDSQSLSDNFLWNFVEDSLGYIWCCSRNGVNRIDKRTGKVVVFLKDTINYDLNHNQVNDIAIYKGNLYANFYGKIAQIPIQYNYSHIKNVVQYISEENQPYVYSFYADNKNEQLYILGIKGLYNYTSNKTYPIQNFSDNLKHPFLTAIQNDTAIIFTNGKVIYTFNFKTEKIEEFDFQFKGQTIYDMLLISEELWVTTSNGVYIFENQKLRDHVIKNKETKQGLSSNSVTAITQDKTGKIWLGTGGKGINIYNPLKDRFKFLGKEFFGEEYSIRSMVQHGNNLFVCAGGFVFILKLKSTPLTQQRFIVDAINSKDKLTIKGVNNFHATYITKGFNYDIIIGTNTGELFILDENLALKKRVNLIKLQHVEKTISDIIVTHNDKIWVTSYSGIYTLNDSYETINQFLYNESNLKSNYFLSAFEDSDNNIWLGSNMGVYQYLFNKKTFVEYSYQKNNLEKSPGFNFVSGFADIGDGNVWMSTYGGGLSKFNKQTQKFEHYTIKDGLANNVCNGILADRENNIWLSTNRGISKFNVDHKNFINYTANDGLYFSEFLLNSFYQNEFGEFFFGSPTSLIIFNPTHIKKSEFHPKLEINKIDINYKTRAFIDYKKIDLYPSDKVITIHYAALNFDNTSRIKYKYRLEGYDDKWVETNEFKTTYTSLPDGNYTFYINSTNVDGVWNTKPEKLMITVHPPFYKAWWFILVGGSFILIVTIFIIRYFAQRKIKNRLQDLKVQQQIHQEKQRISRDLHDNIGAQITYLISSIDNESYKLKQENNVFEHLSDKARNVMLQLRQTLWVINKEEITFADFVDKIRDYSTQILSVTQINSQVINEGNSHEKLSPILVSYLFRIVQEAHNNIIKHSKATEVVIKFILSDSELNLQITDNGIGISEVKHLDDHFGLKNMKDRTKELKGNFRISSEEGCQIHILIPLKQGK